MYDVNSELFIQMDDGGRIGHDKKLFKRRFRLDVMYGNMCLVIRVVNNWNSLPAQCINCCNMNTFKKQCDTGIGNCKIIRPVDSEHYMRKPVLTHAISNKTLMASVNLVNTVFLC